MIKVYINLVHDYKNVGEFHIHDFYLMAEITFLLISNEFCNNNFPFSLWFPTKRRKGGNFRPDFALHVCSTRLPAGAEAFRHPSPFTHLHHQHDWALQAKQVGTSFRILHFEVCCYQGKATKVKPNICIMWYLCAEIPKDVTSFKKKKNILRHRTALVRTKCFLQHIQFLKTFLQR